MSSEELDRPEALREEVVGPTDFDHETLRAMERFAPYTLNNEHLIYGKTDHKDVAIKKAELGIITQMTILSSGTPTAEQRILAKAAEVIGESTIDRGDGGFERKAGISTIEYQIANEAKKMGGGIWNRMRHPFGGGGGGGQQQGQVGQ